MPQKTWRSRNAMHWKAWYSSVFRTKYILMSTNFYVQPVVGASESEGLRAEVMGTFVKVLGGMEGSVELTEPWKRTGIPQGTTENSVKCPYKFEIKQIRITTPCS